MDQDNQPRRVLQYGNASCCGFPLVGIVEFIMYGCTRYFREQYQAVVVLLNDPGVIFCNRVTNYMKEKIEKAQYHRVVSMGTKDQR